MNTREAVSRAQGWGNGRSVAGRTFTPMLKVRAGVAPFSVGLVYASCKVELPGAAARKLKTVCPSAPGIPGGGGTKTGAA